MRRDSIEAGTFEDLFFAVPAKGETDWLLRLARAALDAGRRVRRAARIEERELTPVERALAAISASVVRVYEEICALARLNAGRVYPSYDWLADKTALGRATIARALDALEDAGFLVRQRRFRRVEGEGVGPRWEQTSNADRPTMPKRLLALLPRWLRPAPVPVDVEQHQAEEAEEMTRLRGRLSCRDLARATLSGPLARVLARLGGAIDARDAVASREAHNDPEPDPNFIEQEKCSIDPEDRYANSPKAEPRRTIPTLRLGQRRSASYAVAMLPRRSRRHR